MVPRNEILGIDIDDDIDGILAQISTSQHTRLPVYKGNINSVIGVLHLRRAVRFIQQGTFTKAELLALTREPYFVPEGTPLHTQLFNFQKQKRRIALVVDEYGDVIGIVTLRITSYNVCYTKLLRSEHFLVVQPTIWKPSNSPHF